MSCLNQNVKIYNTGKIRSNSIHNLRIVDPVYTKISRHHFMIHTAYGVCTYIFCHEDNNLSYITQ